MLTTNPVSFSVEHVAEHTTAGEGILKVQLIDSAHQTQIRFADLPGQVIHAAATDSHPAACFIIWVLGVASYSILKSKISIFQSITLE